MNQLRGLNETIKDYFRRICINRKELGLIWDDIAELMNNETGDKFTESRYRKKWANYKEGFNDAVTQAVDTDTVLKNQELSLLKIQEEKVLLRDNRTALALQIRVKARFENFVEELKNAMKENLPPLQFSPKIIEDSNKDLIMVVAFSDFHVGAGFSNYFGEYSIEIFKRRLEEYVEKIIEFGKENKVGILKILSLGDVISGTIHVSTRIQNVENVVQQTKISAEYIAQALCKLAENFELIEYYTALGNHGRVTPSKEESLYEENYESFIPWWIKARLVDIKNIKIMDNEVDEGIIVAKMFNDEVIFGVHGDKDSFSKASTNLPVMIRKFPISIWCGHLHSFGVETKHGIEMIKSGCLGGTDEYAKDNRLTGKPCQTIAIYDREGLMLIKNVNFK